MANVIDLGLALTFIGVVAILVRPSATSILLGAQMICTLWSFVFASLPEHQPKSLHSNYFLVFASICLFLIFSVCFAAFLIKWAGLEKDRTFND